MWFTEIEWSEAVCDKLGSKHGVDMGEVIEALGGEAYVLRAREGLHQVLGRTEAGRYLAVFVRDLGRSRVRVVTARDMDEAERRHYSRR